MTDKLRVEEIVWAYLREAFCIVCPRCNGFECSFCEGKGWVYINNRFKRLHEKTIEIMKGWAAQEAEPLVEALVEIKKYSVPPFTGIKWTNLVNDIADKALTAWREKYGEGKK